MAAVQELILPKKSNHDAWNLSISVSWTFVYDMSTVVADDGTLNMHNEMSANLSTL